MPTPTPSTNTIPTSSTSLPSHDTDLFRVDPATLEPISGNEPIVTADSINGYSSPNGEWIGINIWIEPDTSVFRVIEVATGAIVTEKTGALWPVGVADDGVVYSFSDLQYSGSRFRKLAHGVDGLETVFDDFPADFSFWGAGVLLGPSGAAWLGTFGEALRARVAGLVVVDLATGAATTHRLPELNLGALTGSEIDEGTNSEVLEPALVWDEPRNRVLVVHGFETRVSTLDLETGEFSTHDWSSSTSWLADLFAWLVPPAHAKGEPSPGTTRSAALDPAGDWLYVASSVSKINDSEDDWHVEGIPQGVELISTKTWDLAHRWEIPASEVTLSPDGRYVVTTGVSWTESFTEFEERAEDVLVIDTESHEIVGRFEPPSIWPEIDFSPDGKHLYISESIEGTGRRIDIVDVATMKLTGSAEGTLFAEALLLVTGRP